VLPYGALWATVDWPGEPFVPRLLEQRYARAEQMVGLLPTGRGKAAFFWSLKGDDHPGWLARGMADWCSQVCHLWPECEAVAAGLAEPEQLTFARYAHRTTRAPTGERIVHIGDAWHAASPQLGQGANMALLDARALALALREPDLQAALSKYAALRRWHVRLYQALSLSFTPLYQSDSHWLPRLRDALVPIATTVPPLPQVLAAMVAGRLLDPFGPLDLAL
jgi:salicylate hydroxylase